MNSVATAAVPIACANVATSAGASPAEDETLVPPYVILERELPHGAGQTHPIRIGVIGFVPPQIMTSPGGPCATRQERPVPLPPKRLLRPREGQESPMITPIIETLDGLHGRYDALFCDLWGCVHDGVRALPEAVDALRVFRASGGAVVLLTNAPRPRASVAAQIARLGVPEDAWDVIATSGDAARVAMFQGVVGRKVWHIGEPHDAPFFEPVKLLENPVDIEKVDLNEAEGIVCTGPFDPHADPSVMRPQFLLAKTKGLKLLCANPDIVVDRGERREWCAGALAELYEEMGGESLYFGKPHPPIYDLARRRLEQMGRIVSDDRILAVGDGIFTDIRGGMGENIDTLFVTGGLARVETGTTAQPDPAKLEAFLATAELQPTYAIGALR
jgi:HAD superfamily hydrolase (TIGR01459 family)